MKVIAINGSPRKNGNTRLLLEAVLEPLAKAGWETEYVQIGGKAIQGCRACFKCWETKDNRCIFGGKDVFNETFAKVLEADAVILGSPTYFADVSTEMKAFIDRAGFVAMRVRIKVCGPPGTVKETLAAAAAANALETPGTTSQAMPSVSSRAACSRTAP